MNTSFPSADLTRQIRDHLTDFLERKRDSLGGINRWGNWLIDQLASLNTGGKMHRAQLTLLMYESLGYPINEDVLKVASSMELIQGSLLIHDDIIDRDLLRRGKPTVASLLREKAKAENAADPGHTGDGMALAGADMGFFAAFELLSDLRFECKKFSRLMSAMMTCYCQVALGQMDDTWIGALPAIPEEPEILSCYRYKTARYSISLPLICAAIVADMPDTVAGSLDDIGQDMGILFQLKDDELGLFGDSGKTGKPVGADIAEGKKTLYVTRYIRKYPEKRDWLEKYLGKHPVSAEDIRSVQDEIIRSGIRQDVGKLMTDMEQDIGKRIPSLEIPDTGKTLLTELLQFITGREK